MFLVFAQAFLIKKSSDLGVNELASMEILLVLFSLCSYTIDAFAHSAETLVGNSIGSRNKKELKSSIYLTFEMAFLFSFFIAILLFSLRDLIIFSITDIEPLRKIIQDLWILVIITPPISVLAFQYDGIFVGSTLVKEMRNSIVISCLIFYVIIEFLINDIINLKYLYSCFLIFLILRGIILFLYNKRVYSLVDG
jgi:MATE family multidrug resistance protein